MAAASACSKLCCQQKHVSAQVPTLDEGDTPKGVESSCAASAAWTLPIPPSLVSPGVWTYPAHRLVSHICSSLPEAEIPQETPMNTHRERTQGYPGGMGEGTWPGLELPCYLSVPQAKGQKPLGGRPEATPTAFPHIQLSRVPASGKGQTAKYPCCLRTCWGLLSAVKPGYLVSVFCWVLLPGSDIISWVHCHGPLHSAPQASHWDSVCSPTTLGNVQAQ